MWQTIAILILGGGLLLWAYRSGRKVSEGNQAKETLGRVQRAKTIRAGIGLNNARDRLRDQLK